MLVLDAILSSGHPSHTATSRLADLAGAAELGIHQDAGESELLDLSDGRFPCFPRPGESG